MAPTGASLWGPIASKLARQALDKLSQAIKNKVQQVSRAAGAATAELEPVLARNSPRQPISRAAAIRQARGRWYTTHSAINASIRRFSSSARFQTSKIDRAAFPESKTSSAVKSLTSRAPFASTLRPNLTGGTLSRTAGGYSLGGGRIGGARYFSHTSAAPAQIVENVSSAVRAFWLSGQKVHYDGVTPAGEKRFRSVSPSQAKATEQMQLASKFAPGSYIDFKVSPTVTALSPLGAAFPYGSMRTESPTLNTSGFLDVLSVDFSRALKDLAAVMNDLKKLATFGDLSIELASPSVIRIRFPGCDAETVESLCREVCVTRGVVCEDADFDLSAGAQVALMFPFASTSDTALSSPADSVGSQSGHDRYELEDFSSEDEEIEGNPWLHSPEGYESLEGSEIGSAFLSKSLEHTQAASEEYEGLEGIYKFLNQCDAAQRTSL